MPADRSCEQCGATIPPRHGRGKPRKFCTECRPPRDRSRRQESADHASPAAPARHGTNVSELDETIASLRDIGRFERVDSALLQALRTMAGALDDNPQNAPLWKQYREALRELTADDSSDSVDEALKAVFS